MKVFAALRYIREVRNGRIYTTGTKAPLEAEDASQGLLQQWDLCVIRDGKAYALTSEEFGTPKVLEVKDDLA